MMGIRGQGYHPNHLYGNKRDVVSGFLHRAVFSGFEAKQTKQRRHLSKPSPSKGCPIVLVCHWQPLEGAALRWTLGPWFADTDQKRRGSDSLARTSRVLFPSSACVEGFPLMLSPYSSTAVD